MDFRNDDSFERIQCDFSVSVTKKSLDSTLAVLNSCQLILELNPFPGSNRLSKVLAAFHAELVGCIQTSPKVSISYMKELVTYYVWFLRGGSLADRPSISYYFDPASGISDHPIHLRGILEWLSSDPGKDLLSVDQRSTALQVIHCVLSMHRVLMLSAPKLNSRQRRQLKRRLAGSSRSSLQTVALQQSDLNSIVSPTKVDPLLATDLVMLLPKALAALAITPDSFRKVYGEFISSFRPYVISSAGPNGPAMWSGYKDAWAVVTYTPLCSALHELLEEWGEVDAFPFPQSATIFSMLLYLRQAARKAKQMYSQEQLSRFVTGRLHAIAELGGKIRIVAIVDYWTQMILSPLHDTVASFNKSLDMDGTYDQGKIALRVKEWTSDLGHTEVYSYDLSAATDRLPLHFQTSILSYLLTPKMARGWAGAIANRRFATPGYDYVHVRDGPHSDYPSYVKYGCGQPMGAKSSFPMLALTHHVIVQLAAILAGHPGSFVDYVILGDDVTIANAKVAKKYLFIMVDLLGLEISLSKSYVHLGGNTLRAGEICKRLYLDGLELSALNAKLISRVCQNWRLIPDLQNLLYERGFQFPGSSFFTFCAGIHKRAAVFAIRLNLVPESVSGLKKRITPLDFTIEDMLDISFEQVKQAHLFCSIVQQLKRFDLLIKATQSLAIALTDGTAFARRNKALGPDGERIDPHLRSVLRKLGAAHGQPYIQLRTTASLRAILRRLPDVTDPHPIALASTSEYIRVMQTVGDIRADQSRLIRSVRSGTLDSVRNSLSSIWMTPDKVWVTSITDRPLFNRTIQTIQRIKHSPDRRLQFTIYIDSLDQFWTIVWELGKEVTISPTRYTSGPKLKKARKRYLEALAGLFMMPNAAAAIVLDDKVPSGARLQFGFVGKRGIGTLSESISSLRRDRYTVGYSNLI